MSLRSLHKRFFYKFLKNKSYEELANHVDVFLDKYLDKIFYLPAIKKLHEAVLDNHYIALFSSSPFFLVKPIADVLKIKEYRSTLYDLNDEKKFSKISVIVDGRQKAEYAKDLIEKLNVKKENFFVYSDSIEDFELFKMAGIKVAVKPCRKLYKIAKKNSWEII
ncbi:MAG: hypothetical protein ACD_7C00037G0001 [uncultured bacterium]|nr:MAG: hypothetical protein ACD_7C00037G0001 [uncultured bacterium]